MLCLCQKSIPNACKYYKIPLTMESFGPQKSFCMNINVFFLVIVLLAFILDTLWFKEKKGMGQNVFQPHPFPPLNWVNTILSRVSENIDCHSSLRNLFIKVLVAFRAVPVLYCNRVFPWQWYNTRTLYFRVDLDVEPKQASLLFEDQLSHLKSEKKRSSKYYFLLTK